MPHLKTSSGIEWYYECEGEGNPVLFVHGWGVDGRIWRQQTKHFSDHHQVLTVDLPGHGRSGWKDVTLASMTNDLRDILDSLYIRNVTIVGSSLGGLFSLKFYSFFPIYVTRLIFVGAMPKFAKSEDYPYGLDVAEIRKLGDQVETAYPAIMNIFFRSLFTKEERASRRFKWLQRFRKTDVIPPREPLLAYLNILEKEDLRDVLNILLTPIHIINGREDSICQPEVVRYIQQICPQAKYAFFEKCGHFPFLSKPHEFNQMLEECLDEKHPHKWL